MQRLLERRSSSPARRRSRAATLPVSAAARKTGIVTRRRDRLEVDGDRHADAQLVERHALDVGHHPRAFLELDDRGDVGHPLVERRQVVLRARPSTCRASRGPTPASTRRRRSSTSGRTAAGRSGRRRTRCSAGRGTGPRGSRPRTAGSPCRASGCRSAVRPSVSRPPAAPRRPRPGSSPRRSRSRPRTRARSRCRDASRVTATVVRQRLAGPGLLREAHPVRLEVADPDVVRDRGREQAGA